LERRKLYRDVILLLISHDVDRLWAAVESSDLHVFLVFLAIAPALILPLLRLGRSCCRRGRCCQLGYNVFLRLLAVFRILFLSISLGLLLQLIGKPSECSFDTPLVYSQTRVPIAAIVPAKKLF